MSKNSVSDWDETAANNTDIGGINVAEGMQTANVNNALREMMSQVAKARSGWDNNTVGAASVTPTGGAVAAPLADLLARVWVSEIVADYDPATGTGTDNTARINAELIAHGVVYVPPGNYLFRGVGIDVPDGCALIGARPMPIGTDAETDIFEAGTSTVFVFRGLTKSHSATHMITGCDLTGGAVPNPSAAEAYTSDSGTRLDFYRLTDFTTRDASGATAATAKTMRVGVRMGRGSALLNCAVKTVATSGAWDVASDQTNFGDPVDIGVWARNGIGATIAGCHISSGFLVAAIAATTATDSERTPETDRLAILGCYIEGHVGVCIRTADRVRVTSTTSNSITVPWFASHQFAASGSVEIDGVTYAYTGLTFSSPNLTFTGVTPDPSGVAAGSGLIRAQDASFGTGGVRIEGCFIRQRTHASLRPSTDSFFDPPASKCGCLIEASGYNARGIHVVNTYLHSREDVAVHLHDVRDVYFVNSYHEAKTNAAGDPCARFIALSFAALTARSIGTPITGVGAGNVHLSVWSQTESQSDLRPVFRTASSYGRFGTGSDREDGLFEPEITSNAIGYTYGQGVSGTWLPIRFPWASGDEHPLRFLDRSGSLRGSFDDFGRLAIGRDYDATAELPHQLTLYGGGGLRAGAIATSGTSGFRAQNDVTNVEYLIQTDGRASIEVADTEVLALAVPSTANATSLSLIVSNGSTTTKYAVAVGAPDSGGSGRRILTIPN